MAEAAKSLCIVGAGAAGLIAANVAKRFFFGRKQLSKLTIFERQAANSGGLWRYGEQESAMYRDLHANLPRRLMEIPGFRFGANVIPREHMSGCGPALTGLSQTQVHLSATATFSPSSFAPHAEVLSYLEALSCSSGLGEHIRHGINVNSFAWQPDRRKFVVNAEEEFDILLWCGGRFRQPNLPQALVAEAMLLQRENVSVLHSKDFDNPEAFRGKHVVVIGCGSSGRDIVGLIGALNDTSNAAASLTWVGPGNRIQDRYLQRGLTAQDLEEKFGLLISATITEAVQRLPKSGPLDLVFSTGYQYDLPDELFPEISFLNSSKTALEYAQFSAESGFTRLAESDGPMGFAGLMPVAVPLGTFHYQAKRFLESVLGPPMAESSEHNKATERVPAAIVTVAPPLEAADMVPASHAEAFFPASESMLRQGEELTFRHLLQHAKCPVESADLRWRSDLFDFCEARIRTDFTTYRDWQYWVEL